MPAEKLQPALSNVQVVCITGAKGGIGKTNVSINLSIAASRLRKKVLLFDADLSLANIDVLLGLRAKRNLSHVIDHQCGLQDIIINGPDNVRIIPASSGLQRLCQLGAHEHAGIIHAFNELTDDIDLLIVDTAAGITNQVMDFVRACSEIIIVVCNEPGSITDAYAQIKILSQNYGIHRYRILANMIKSQHEGKVLFNKLQKTADQFLDVQLNYIGYIPFDEHIRLAMQQQKAVTQVYPHTLAAQAFEKLAHTVTHWPIHGQPGNGMQFFFERFIHANAEPAALTA